MTRHRDELEQPPPHIRDPNGMDCGPDYEKLWDAARKAYYDTAAKLREAEAELAKLKAAPVGRLRTALEKLTPLAKEVVNWVEAGSTWPIDKAIAEADAALAATAEGERRVFVGTGRTGITYEDGDTPWAEVEIERDKQWITLNVADPLSHIEGKQVEVVVRVLPTDPRKDGA
jgi:hypothetical protein